MKKILALLFVIVLVVALGVGCKTTATEETTAAAETKAAETKAAETGEPITINFMTVGDPYVGAIKVLLPEFEKKYGIKVNVESIPFLNLHEKAVLELSSKSGSYDLISMDIPWTGEFCEAGYALELTDLYNRDKAEINSEDFLQGAWKGLALWDGKVMAMPLAPYYMYLHYRTDKFQEKGLNPPETADDFVNAIIKLCDKENNFYGLAAGLKVGANIVGEWSAYYNGFGGKTFVDAPNDYSCDINGEIGIFTTDLFKSILDYMPPGILQMENVDRWNSFMHGNAGMVPVFNANSPMFETAEDSKVVGKVGYTHLPIKDENSKASLPFGGFSIIINESSKNVEASWTFIKWLTSPEIDQQWIQVPGTPGVPNRMSTLSDPENLKKYPYFKVVLDAEKGGYADGVNYRSRIPEWVQMEDIIGTALSLAISGEKDTKEALDDAAEKVDALLKDKGYPIK